MIFRQQLHSGLLKILVSVVLASQLLGCGGGSGGSGGSASNADAPLSVDLNGSVGDGPIVGATISIYSARGNLLGSVASDVTASYILSVKARRRDYPLLLKVNGGTDLVTGDAPDFQLMSVAASPSVKSVNINPFSTLVVKMSQSMSGGLNASNVSAAQAIVSASYAFGLDPSVIGDPITTLISDSNAANMIKAGEVLGETVRRTRDALLAAGTAVSADAVMAAIGADLSDGALDGAGANGVVPAVSATAKVVSAQVLVEALSNNLKVGGVVSTGVIDQAIAITHPGVSASQLTGSVRITSGLLEQTQVALAAAQVLDSGAAVNNIVSEVGGIAPNALPAEVATVLPADASTALNQAVTQAPYASAGELAAINQVVGVTGSGGATSGGTTSGSTTSGGTTSGGTASGGSTTGSGTTASNTGGNLALGKPVVASSVDSPDDQASYAVDGDTSSRWSSWYSDPQWIYVDLGATYAVDQVVLNWHEAAYGSGYDIQVSDDAQNWVTVFAESNGDGGIDDISFAPVSARYVRLLGLQRGTGWGYSLWEFEVYGASTTAQSSGTASGTTSSGTSGSGTSTSGTSGSGTTSSGTASSSTTNSGTAAVQTGSLTVRWTAPVSRADGTPLSLSDIDGYHIHYGTSAGNYPNSFDVTDGTAQSASVNNLPVGTYYVVMTTYDVNGLESAYSSMVSKLVQ
jgi:hypothetical protein